MEKRKPASAPAAATARPAAVLEAIRRRAATISRRGMIPPVASLHPFVDLSYRAVAFDRSHTAGSIQMQFRGPLGGGGFVF